MNNIDGTLVVVDVIEVSVVELSEKIVQFNFHTLHGDIPVRLVNPSPEWKGNTLDRLGRECSLPYLKAV